MTAAGGVNLSEPFGTVQNLSEPSYERPPPAPLVARLAPMCFRIEGADMRRTVYNRAPDLDGNHEGHVVAFGLHATKFFDILRRVR